MIHLGKLTMLDLFICEPWFYVNVSPFNMQKPVTQVGLCVCVCVCTLVRALVVKMYGNNLSRCFVFRQGGLYVYVCVCVCVLLCEPWLSRYIVFRQQPVKMFRL